MQIPATLCLLQHSFPLMALIDSGADDCFLDREFALRAGIPLEPLSNPLTANGLDGRLLARVTHHTVPINLILSGNHCELIRLNVISTPDSPLVLAIPGSSYTIPTWTGLRAEL